MTSFPWQSPFSCERNQQIFFWQATLTSLDFWLTQPKVQTHSGNLWRNVATLFATSVSGFRLLACSDNSPTDLFKSWQFCPSTQANKTCQIKTCQIKLVKKNLSFAFASTRASFVARQVSFRKFFLVKIFLDFKQVNLTSEKTAIFPVHTGK